jgi:hypothetical protein
MNFTGQHQVSGAIQLCSSRQKKFSTLMKGLLENPFSAIGRQSGLNKDKKLLKCHAQSGAFESKAKQCGQDRATPG